MSGEELRALRGTHLLTGHISPTIKKYRVYDAPFERSRRELSIEPLKKSICDKPLSKYFINPICLRNCQVASTHGIIYKDHQ